MIDAANVREGNTRLQWTSARRALVCLRYGVGDVVMQLPALQALRRAVPEARITGLGAFPAIQVLEREDCVNDVIDVARWGLRHRWDLGTSCSREALTRWIEGSGFDLIFDPSHAAPGLAQSIWSLDVATYDADPAAEAEALRGGASGYQAIRAAVLAGWGLPVPDPGPPRLHLCSSERRFAEDFLAANGLQDRVLIAASAVASHPLKRWPVRRLARAVMELTERHGCDAVLFHGTEPVDLAKLEDQAQVHSVPVLHLRRTAALLERCAVFICNDTGLMHLAAAVGTPTVTTFGPTASQLFAPDVPHAIAIESGIPCPHRRTTALGPPNCWGSEQCLIGDRSCTSQIEVGAVTRAASGLLRKHAASPPRVHARSRGVRV